MITANTTLIWNGQIRIREIKTRLYANLKDAVLAYYWDLKQAISTPGSPGNYSNPGDPPFQQSINLQNSIKYQTEFNSRQLDGETLVGEISTDVPYAPTLEFGGTLQ